MIYAFILILIIAAVAAFLLLLADKLGAIEYVQVHGTELLSEMFRCSFCLSWWTNVILFAVMAVIVGNGWYLLAPIIATPVTRKLL